MTNMIYKGRETYWLPRPTDRRKTSKVPQMLRSLFVMASMPLLSSSSFSVEPHDTVLCSIDEQEGALLYDDFELLSFDSPDYMGGIQPVFMSYSPLSLGSNKWGDVQDNTVGRCYFYIEDDFGQRNYYVTDAFSTKDTGTHAQLRNMNFPQ